jgi:hypothetical protein
MKLSIPHPLRRFLETLSAALIGLVVGSQLTLYATRTLDHDQRKNDALMEAYFGDNSDSSTMSADEYQYRQSVRRMKFSLLASPSTLRSLASLVAKNKDCDKDSRASACDLRLADELWLQRMELDSPNQRDSEAAFREIVSSEKKRQDELTLPWRSRPFWVITPVGIEINPDDLEVIKAGRFPEGWHQTFPSEKYVIYIQVGYDVTHAKRSDTFSCSAFAGVTSQPKLGHRPDAPLHYQSVYSRKAYKNDASPKECMTEAANRAVIGTFDTSFEVLKRSI